MTVEPSDKNFPLAFAMTIAISFLVLAVSFAARAILGLGMQEWASDFGWSRIEISGVGSIALLAMTMTVPLAGYAADRWGPRFVLGMGCFALAGGRTRAILKKTHDRD
jgi:MFS family permease